MIKKTQVYISDSLDVYKNLATEKYLFDSVSDDCLLLYLWQNENTIVIGRNQNPHNECNLSLVKEENVKVARRLSGGGAVFHDVGNLNFTFICHKENYNLSNNIKVIQDACKMAGISAEISGRNDILACGRKFSGNAFYNSGDKAYHHGTIMVCADIEKMQKLLTPSAAKLNSKGVKSVKSRVINLCDLAPELTCDDMKKYMIAAFENFYGVKAVHIGDIDAEEIKPLTKEFSSWEYIYTKSAPYTFSNDGYFSWGRVQINLSIENECIKDAEIFTDSMNWELPVIIKKSICGSKFRYDDMSDRLYSVLEKDLADDVLSLLF